MRAKKDRLAFPSDYDGGILDFVATRFHRLPPHTHDELEMNLVVQGAGTYLAADRRYEVTRNTQIWFPPNQVHFLVEHSPDFEMWVVFFRRRMLQRLCRVPALRVLLNNREKRPFCDTLTEYQAARLRTLLGETRDCGDDAVYLNASLAYALLFAWRAHTADERIAVGSDVHPSVAKAARLLNEDPGISSMSEIARRAGLSVSRLPRLFKQQTGVSFVTFRNKQRLRHFLLEYGHGQSTTMLEAALAGGFGSYPQFYRVFKQLMGCTPAEYRRKFLR